MAMLQTLITNIQTTLMALPTHSPLRPALVSSLTRGLSKTQAMETTSYSESAIKRARRLNGAKDVLGKAKVNV
jgi:hypothetical protein